MMLRQHVLVLLVGSIALAACSSKPSAPEPPPRVAPPPQQPSSPLDRTPEIALVNAGRCAMTIGEVRNAEQYFRRALAAQPGNALANYGLALVAYKEARFDEARSWIKGAIQTNAPAPEALYLGLCVERKLGDRQAELSYISQLRNRYPDSVETRAITTE